MPLTDEQLHQQFSEVAEAYKEELDWIVTFLEGTAQRLDPRTVAEFILCKLVVSEVVKWPKR